MAILTVTNINDSGANSFRERVSAATSGDIIEFDSSISNSTVYLTSGEVVIDKHLTIRANKDITLDGMNNSRILYSNPNLTISLEGLIFNNGYTPTAGGAYHADEDSDITISNCEFRNNYAYQGGGGVCSSWRNKLLIDQCLFDNNVSEDGSKEQSSGGLYIRESTTNPTVTNSIFTNNRGINGGGIHSVLANTTIENCKFINNDTTLGGTFTGPTKGYGAGLYFDGANGGQISVNNSYFEGNICAGQGAGIFIFLYSGETAVFDRCDVRNNIAENDTLNQGLGGGLRIGGDGAHYLIKDSSFTNNRAYESGGGIFKGGNSTMDLIYCTISNNIARRDTANTNGLGGGIFLDNNTTSKNITNCTIAYNKVGWQGGGIYEGNSSTTLTNSIVAFNEANNGGNTWNVKHNNTSQLADGGKNIQYPDKHPFDPQDVYVTATAYVVDPELDTLASNGGDILTHALLPTSPAIDYGNPVSGRTTDSRNVNIQNAPDVGAYEYETVHPEIEVLDNRDPSNRINIVSGTNYSLDFGTIVQGINTTAEIVIKNIGTATLGISNISISSTAFSINTTNLSITPLDETILTVTFDTSTVGVYSSTISISSNDIDENPFTFDIEGEVIAAGPTSTITVDYTGSDTELLIPLTIDTQTMVDNGILNQNNPLVFFEKGGAVLDYFIENPFPSTETLIIIKDTTPVTGTYSINVSYGSATGINPLNNILPTSTSIHVSPNRYKGVLSNSQVVDNVNDHSQSSHPLKGNSTYSTGDRINNLSTLRIDPGNTLILKSNIPNRERHLFLVIKYLSGQGHILGINNLADLAIDQNYNLCIDQENKRLTTSLVMTPNTDYLIEIKADTANGTEVYANHNLIGNHTNNLLDYPINEINSIKFGKLPLALSNAEFLLGDFILLEGISTDPIYTRYLSSKYLIPNNITVT